MIQRASGLVAPGPLEVIENKIIPMQGEVGPEGIGRWTAEGHIDLTQPEVHRLIESLGEIIIDASQAEGEPRTYDTLVVFARGAWGIGEQAAENWGFATDECASVTAKGYDETQRLKELRITQLPPRELIEGKDVIALDEIWDSGRVLRWAKKTLVKDLGAKSVTTVALIWRNVTGSDGPDHYAIEAKHPYYYDFPKLKRNPRAHLLHKK